MPRGERQTTGTAQALLGAKQIAAQERASKRATVADYVKTGVGALKSVGDYLQQKQSLEQNQDKINLEKSLFSAQYGGPAEQEATRERKRQLELANIGLAGAQTKVAQGTVEADIAAKKALAAKAGSEAKISEVTARFAEQFAGGKLELAKVEKDKILQDIESSKAGITDAAEGRRLDGLRLEVEKTYREALMADMKEKGLLSKRQMKIFEKRYKDETDPARRVAMMTEFEKRAAESGARKAELDVEFAEGTLENRIADIALDLKGKRKDVKRKGFENDTAKIVAHYARLRETSSIDNVIAHTDLLDQQMKTLISKAKDDKERLALEGRRVKIAEVHGRAVLDKMEKDGTLAEKDFNLLKEKWETTKDPVKREAMLSPFDKKMREAQLKTEEAREEGIKVPTALAGVQVEAAKTALEKQKKWAIAGFSEEQEADAKVQITTLEHTKNEYPSLAKIAGAAQKELRGGELQGENIRLMRDMTALFRDDSSMTGEKLATPEQLSKSNLNGLAEEGGGIVGEGLLDTLKGTTLVAKLGTVWHNLAEKNRPSFVKWLKEEWPEGPKKMRSLAALRKSATERFFHRQSIFKAGKRALGLGGLTTQMEYHAERKFLLGLADHMDDPGWIERGEPTLEFTPDVMRSLDMSPPSERVRNLPPER